jgi:hypothetical protein
VTATLDRSSPLFGAGCVWVIVLALCPGTGHAGQRTEATSKTLDGKAVSEDIARRGAPAVFRELFSDPEGWDTLFEGIASGDVGWLQVAQQAQGTVEAGGAQELQMAVGRALERNPEGVLLLLKSGYSNVSAVCGCKGVVDGLGFEFDVALQTVERRRAAVKRVTTAGLRAQKLDCLAWLDTLEADMKKHREQWFVP